MRYLTCCLGGWLLDILSSLFFDQFVTEVWLSRFLIRFLVQHLCLFKDVLLSLKHISALSLEQKLDRRSMNPA